MGLDKECGLELHEKHEKGERNLITDVPGIKVGHFTLHDGDIHTGVTAILPHGGNLFRDKVMASCFVINGFGKSAGLIQIEELGTIETPIIMTNTLSVGTALTALVKYMLRQNVDIGVSTGTVNCIVTECNDGRLSDIRGLHVREEHVWQAIETASSSFEEGAVGSGSGMTCLGLKGGIGSASRVVPVDGHGYVLGALVMTNFGCPGNLVIGGDYMGRRMEDQDKSEKDKGSIIIVLGTDIPMSERQLKRVAKRTTISLGRTGSFLGTGSGDIAIAFTTANRPQHYSEKSIVDIKMLHDANLDCVFESAIEAAEEAIISALYHADTTYGVRGSVAKGLREYL